MKCKATPSAERHICRSALDISAPNARTECHSMTPILRALSASLKERGRVKWFLCAKRLVAVKSDGVVVGGARASEGGGVEVERPQPEARTNDLDAGAGWRMLEVDDVRVQLSARVRDARSAPGSLGW
jgi:hypothetical protein